MKFSTAILAISLFAADAASKAEPSSLSAGNTEKVEKASHLRGDVKEDSNEHRRSLQDDKPVNTNQKCFAPDCQFREGTYLNSAMEVARWWAFVPAGANACPEEGCPLFVAVDGTGDEFFDPPDQQTWMMEMVQRGFVGVTFEYQNTFPEFGFCYTAHGLGSWVEDQGVYGVVQKAEAAFDATKETSVINQVCEGPEAFANCNLGIAVQGVSQGSLILGQATNVEKRISAALLWAVGDVATIPEEVLQGALPFDESINEQLHGLVDEIALPCMDALQLPPPRMRLINGDHDRFFGPNAEGTILQHKHMLNNFYDCGDSRDCLTRAPSTVQDTYTGGEIANEGGYFIVDNSGHTGFFRCLACVENECTVEERDACDEPSPIFTNEAIYGGPAGYDWLARTARIPYIPPQGSDFDKITMELDLSHWRLLTTGSDMGFFVEWADSNGAFGQRARVAEGGVYQKVAEFSGEQVPANTIGFRLHAASADGAFLDQLHVRTSEGDTFKGLSFGEDNGGGWCISMDPNDTFYLTECYGDQAFRCIDFCTSSSGDVEVFHFCDDNELSMCTSEAAPGADAGSFCLIDGQCASGNCGFSSWTCPSCCMEGLDTDEQDSVSA